MKRRTLIKSSATALLASSLPKLSLAMASADKSGKTRYDYTLTAEPATARLAKDGDSQILGFNGQFPAPVIRAKQGQPLRVKFINKLAQYHPLAWHTARYRHGRGSLFNPSPSTSRRQLYL